MTKLIKYESSEKVITFFNNRGIDCGFDGIDYYGNSSLMWALRKRNKEIAMMLLELKDEEGKYVLEKKHLDLQNNEKCRALDLAIQNEAFEVAKVLLERGVDCTYEDCNEVTPLMRALLRRNEEIALILLNMRNDEGKYMLEKKYLDLQNNKTSRALDLAIKFEALDAVKALLDRGVECAYELNDQWTPLMSALDRGNEEIALMLLNMKDEEGKNILEKKHLDLENDKKVRALDLAIKSDSYEAAKVLLERGVDCTYEQRDMRTPLIWAIRKSQEKMALMLLNLKDEEGKYILDMEHLELENTEKSRALDIAIEVGDIETAKLLLDRGVEISYQTDDKWTPLMRSLEEESEEISLRLLSAKDEEGNFILDKKHLILEGPGKATALSLATSSDYMYAVAKVLVDRGVEYSYRMGNELNYLKIENLENNLENLKIDIKLIQETLNEILKKLSNDVK